MNEELLIQYCQDGSINEIIELIETNGDNLDINYNGGEALRIVVLDLNYEITKILLEAGADPNVGTIESNHDSAYDIADQINDPSMNNLIVNY